MTPSRRAVRNQHLHAVEQVSRRWRGIQRTPRPHVARVFRRHRAPLVATMAVAANNYAATLIDLKRFEEVRSLMRGLVPVARRVLGESDILRFRIRLSYAEALYKADGATLKELREAVTTIEELERTARRVLGGAHPLTKDIERHLQYARAALRARESLHT